MSPRRLTLLLVWSLGAAYVLAHLDGGWVPHDEGLLAQTAQRVLQGELPHRDFRDAYTGGLAYLNAAGFAVLGANLLTLRIVLFLFFLAWIPALYYVASRFAAPAAAGLAVLLAVVWSVPNYPAAVPSWYNLFFATFGVAAVLRYLEGRRARWLFGAGLCGGLSFLVKIPGLYFVAAALLFLVFHAQGQAWQTGARERHQGRAYRAAQWSALLAFVGLLITVVLGRAGPRELVHFVIPGAAIAGLLAWEEDRRPPGTSAERFAKLAGLAAPFLLGVMIPIGVLAILYLARGALGDLLAGVFVAPVDRLTHAAVPPPALLASVFATVPLVLFLRPAGERAWSRWDRWLIVAMLAAGLLAAKSQPSVYRVVWLSVASLVPASVLIGVALVARGRLDQMRREQLTLLLATVAMAGLVQFPFSTAVYFCYVAPLVVLAALALVSSVRSLRSFPPVAASLFYLLFAGALVNRTSLDFLGSAHRPVAVERLALDRAGIRVPHFDRATYERLARLVRLHAPSGVIYAGPDCPEVYFLSGMRNPTADLFEFLSPEHGTTSRQQIQALLERQPIDVVVVNQAPDFSEELNGDVRTWLRAEFPDSAVVGEFVVRWRR